MQSRYYLVLLLTLTTTVFCGHYGEASVVGTAPNVKGWKGEDVLLRCDIKKEPVVVQWVKEKISDQQQRTAKAEFVDGEFFSREERFDIDKNFSLVISSLEVADEGRYYCEVLLKNSQSFGNSTIMTISSMASGHTIEECADRSQSRQGRCTYQSPSNTPSFTLTCVVNGFKPNVSMLWTEESGKRLISVVSQQITLSDGTYERFETITVSANHGTEQTFMCVAAGDSLNGTSTREITVLPLSVSGKRVNSGLIIGLAIGVPVVIVILFLSFGKYLQSKHPDYLPRKGCSWNPCWRRPNIPERFHEEEELMLEPPSLTQEQIQQCKEELKEYYRVSRSKVMVDPLNFMERVELDDIYTNLSIINQSSTHKTQITYDDLLVFLKNNKEGYVSKRLLIQGEGGVGKTTFCAKIAWDWCQGRILQDLDMVLLIPLRDIKNAISIGGIVKTYLSHSNTATKTKIDDYISRNLSRILIIFDGFDEFDEKLSETSSSEIIRILRREQYNSCKVIVTTRPWRTNEFMTDKSLAETYTFVNVEGFNEENVSTYIMRYFRIREKNNLAENLISFMQENDVFQSNMAPFPIYCAMLCLMWNDFSEERRRELQKLHTFSQIFGEMISFLKQHYASKICVNLQNQNVVEHLKEAGRAIQEISEIALEGLFQKKLSFPEEQFRECHDTMVTCCRQSFVMEEVKCGRTVSRDLAGGMCSSSALRKVRLWYSQFHVEFYKILRVESANCQISEVYISNLYAMAVFVSESAAANLVKFLCRLPNLTCVSITRFDLPGTFLKTIASQASRCIRFTLAHAERTSPSTSPYLTTTDCRLCLICQEDKMEALTKPDQSKRKDSGILVPILESFDHPSNNLRSRNHPATKGTRVVRFRCPAAFFTTSIECRIMATMCALSRESGSSDMGQMTQASGGCWLAWNAAQDDEREMLRPTCDSLSTNSFLRV
ncbi:uncharacterized protein [Diadema antillarum]|uniref:uncharacterized protein n=1 Tax=Diadema antillarum TaxID=105358 RepID=UPI003A882FA8